MIIIEKGMLRLLGNEERISDSRQLLAGKLVRATKANLPRSN